jgi:hypothetical protein
MPNINNITVPSYEALQPYHYIYDNLPIAALIKRQEVLNDAVDFNTSVLENSIGSRIDLSARLNQSLTNNGDLKPTAVDASLHNIGYHEDGIYNEISYIRMKLDERNKLAQIQEGANYLSLNINIPTISNGVFFQTGILELKNSSSLKWRFDAPNNLTADLNYPLESAHIHYYGVTPKPAFLGSDYKNYTTSLSKQIMNNTLRVFINGVQIFSDFEVFVPPANPNANSSWHKNKFSLNNDLISFQLLNSISQYDIIKIDFDVSLAE